MNKNLNLNLEDKLKIERPNLKDSTINGYMLVINRMYKIIRRGVLPSEPVDLNMLRDEEGIELYMETLKSDNTKKNNYNVIVVFLMILLKEQESEINKKAVQALIDKYTKERDILNKKYEDFNKTHEKTEKQKENWLEMDEMINIANSYKKAEYQKYAVLKFHLALPLRNDLSGVKVITNKRYNKLDEMSKSTMNAIIKTDGQYILKLNKYKTSGTYNEKIIMIPKELTPILNKLIRVNHSPIQPYLLINPATNLPFKGNEYTRYFNDIFKHTGKQIGSTLIRNMVLSSKYGAVTKEMQHMASDMLHSDTMQKGYIKY